MLRAFLRDIGGNYATLFAIAILPIMGGVALAVDYSEMTRHRQAMQHALDAAGIAAARRLGDGSSDTEIEAYTREFMVANLNGIDPGNVRLSMTFPTGRIGGDTLHLSAQVDYEPVFLPAFHHLLAERADDNASTFTLAASTAVRLQNTIEVALVLDNSGSMNDIGTGTGQRRINILKQAAKELVDAIAAKGMQMRQVQEPARMSIVPFAASVNVGPQNRNAPWMDVTGISPIHHENFDWSTMPAALAVTRNTNGPGWRKTGNDWGNQKNQPATRFTLFDNLRRTGNHSYATWEGCVETRPYPYAFDVTPAASATPATLFVPMFQPDERDSRGWTGASYGNWLSDVSSNSNAAVEQRNVAKYFRTISAHSSIGRDQGPNMGCSTTAITPLTDITTQSGRNAVKSAIDDMVALGGTNIPEGTAWGWRTLTHSQPFDQGRPDSERTNDKVVIVLTDGFNTYYTPGSLGRSDHAGNLSIYSTSGYTGLNQPGQNKTRLFMGTTVDAGRHNNANFTTAMNQHLETLCGQAKDDGIVMITVTLDLDRTVREEREALEAMERCASDSRHRTDGQGQAVKLFWNADGSNLSEKFGEIADELSNLRIVG